MQPKKSLLHHKLRHPRDMGEREVVAFLAHLAVELKLAAATQSQALAALLFLYKHVVDVPLSGLGEIPRARTPTTLPVVLSETEVRDVLSQLRGDPLLVAMLLYGSGLRLMECLALRVKDIDVERGEISVRRGKGAKDRVTMLPQSLVGPLNAHLREVRMLHAARAWFNGPLRKQSGKVALGSGQAATRCAIRSRLTCSSQGMTSARSRNCSATGTYQRRCCTHMCSTALGLGYVVRWTGWPSGPQRCLIRLRTVSSRMFSRPPQ